ncbi:MCE family protein [Nocardioides alcanivorans]|uniref:MCE family protein n=1 Tax=Nocardioides alcanivorans TaxID=2897352 RepID=UPI001F1F63BA|nr:MCE family protein [Nocardioides alcanivorans]
MSAPKRRQLKRERRWPDLLLGAGYGLIILALLAGALAAYNQTFSDRIEVTLQTGKIGNALQKGSDVKLRGVPVGRVKSIDATATGADVTLALDPDVARDLSPETVARLLPKTLFGERYVALVATDRSGQGLEEGDVIVEDDSTEAVELQEVFDELLPMLQAIKPDKLSAALGETVQMLRDQGESLGDTMSAWEAYFAKLNPLVPEMATNLGKFAQVTEVYADAAPDLLEAVESLAVTNRTLVDEQTKLSTLFASVVGAADDTTGWMRDNQSTIVVLSKESRRALKAVSPYASQFPCLLESARKFIPEMERNLGKGTDEPGIHVKLNVVASRGKYVAGKDKPRFATDGKKSCPYVTGQNRSRGAVLGDETVAPKREVPEPIAPPPGNVLRDQLAAAGLGQANSPSENRLIAELMAPTVGVEPEEYPDWASLLVGPVLRNAEVSIR